MSEHKYNIVHLKIVSIPILYPPFLFSESLNLCPNLMTYLMTYFLQKLRNQVRLQTLEYNFMQKLWLYNNEVSICWYFRETHR